MPHPYFLLLIQFCIILAKRSQGRQIDSLTGDEQCGSSMCIAAIVNSSTVEYILSSTGLHSVGWMGMGFGHQMANSPMVIMWPNTDGSVTLSQRLASRHVMPTVDNNPPREARIFEANTILSGSTPQLAYTILANGNTTQSVIYAFGTHSPGSSAVDAPLMKHIDSGVLQLDLSKSMSTESNFGNSSTNNILPSVNEPLLPYQRMIIAHAILCTIGFLVFLPAGVLAARYLRTFSSRWFTTHWMVQSVLSGPIIVVGVAIGIRSVVDSGALHLDDDHKQLGIALFILFIAQNILGAFIHFVKPKLQTRRPAQNYIHAVLGLTIVGLAFGQVYSGYRTEWHKMTGRQEVSNAANIVFYTWVAVLPFSYALGLFLLPRQFRQERRAA